MSGEDYTGGPLDVAILEVLGERAATHSLVECWAFRPDAISPRRLELRLDAAAYPSAVDAARLDGRWFDGGDYTVHYLETRGEAIWQCRWDRHPKPGEPTGHVHPPPDAAGPVERSPLQTTHHLGVLFGVLDWVSDRLEQVHEE